MKKLILIPGLILILAFQNSFSQIKNAEYPQFNSSYWNISFSAGPTINLIDKIREENKFYPGYNAGFELFYTLEDKKSAIVFSFSYSKEQAHNFENRFYNQSGFTEKKELLFGPRFYIGKDYFIEAAIGNFTSSYSLIENFNKSYATGFGNFEYTYAGIGGSVGGGKTFSLSDNADIMLKGRISFGLPNFESVINTSLNAGVIFKNRKILKKEEKDFADRNIWIITVSGGVVNPEYFHNTNYDLAAKFGVEAALRKSTRVEVFCGLNYNSIYEKYYSEHNRNIIDLTAGPRFLLGGSKIMASAEIGAGIYLYDIGKDPRKSSDALYMGANFGPGIIINISKYVALIAKSNMHFVINNLKKPGGFLTASGGLRYTL